MTQKFIGGGGGEDNFVGSRGWGGGVQRLVQVSLRAVILQCGFNCLISLNFPGRGICTEQTEITEEILY